MQTNHDMNLRMPILQNCLNVLNNIKKFISQNRFTDKYALISKVVYSKSDKSLFHELHRQLDDARNGLEFHVIIDIKQSMNFINIQSKQIQMNNDSQHNSVVIEHIKHTFGLEQSDVNNKSLDEIFNMIKDKWNNTTNKINNIDNNISKKSNSLNIDQLPIFLYEQLIWKYHIHNDSASYIGSGSFSDVYKGLYMNKEVAVKKFKFKTSNEEKKSIEKESE